MYCPLCMTEFPVAETDVGKSVVCPGCQVPILVENKTLLLNCPECGTPLSVEAWMIGEEVVCPECGKEIALHLPKEKKPEDPHPGPAEVHAAAGTLLPGETVGNYQVVRCLGIGGMGEVYLVRHTEMGTVCALKLLKPEIGMQDPVFSERLIREAKIAAKLQHPNLIRVLDAHRDVRNNCSYIVMEYVDGNTISELIKQRGTLPEAMVLTIAKSVASVLITAEMNGIVHRDIKPSNIMLTRDGQVKLADMGIAKVSNEDIGNTLTQGNSVLGTPNYASPEQLRDSHKVDTRSDIYSLGAAMFHMLTGQMPFSGETIFSVISNVLEKEVPSVLEINPKISQGTALLVDRMLSKKQEDRPASAQELMNLLGQIDTAKIASEGQIRKLVKKKKRSAEAEKKTESKRSSRMKIFRTVAGILLLLFILFYGIRSYEVLDGITYRSVQLSQEKMKELLLFPSVRKIRKFVHAGETGASNERELILMACRTGNAKFLEEMDQEKCFPRLANRKYLDSSALMAAIQAEKADTVRWFLKKNPDNGIDIAEVGSADGHFRPDNLKNIRFFVDCGGKIVSLEKRFKEGLMKRIMDADPSPALLDFCLKNGMVLWKPDGETLLCGILKKEIRNSRRDSRTGNLLKWLLRNSLVTPDMLDQQLIDLLNHSSLALKKLLKAGFDPLSPTVKGDHFLNLAIRTNMDSDKVLEMIQACPGFPAETGAESPLYAAVQRGDTLIIKTLLDRGLKPDEEILLAASSPAVRKFLEDNSN